MNTIKQYEFHSPLGVLTLYSIDGEICCVSYPQQNGQAHLRRYYGEYQLLPSELPIPMANDLDRYFKGKPVEFRWQIRLAGTPFQQHVWQEIAKIPYGQTSTYKNIATNLGTKAYQAVGQAVGANPISIIIPCHRVLGTQSFGGYTGGLNIKRWLLTIENALPQWDLV